MTQLAIEALLRQKIGLDTTVLSGSTLVKAVQYRMAEQGITEPSAYLSQLYRSAQELEALIEAVIVPETWFFRDKEPFALVKNHAEHKWNPIHSKRVLRILSVPCSTGEEPYSIAIALIEAGLSFGQFHIDAIDISRKSLRFAQQAIYDKHSFRGTDAAFQARYFTFTKAKYQLCESIRQSVCFQHGNVIDPNFATNKLPYDIIFCRNLLIYLDRPSRNQTIQILTRLLNSQGLLFVGHAETSLVPAAQFVPIHHPFAFAYCKTQPASSSLGGHDRSSGHGKQVQNRPTTAANVHPQRALERFQENDKRHIDQEQDLLSTARVLANQGCLQEAVQQCQAYLNQHRTNAEAHVLLGQVYQAMGHEACAESCFRKALYLNPKHLEALMHLALLLEQQGDLNSAATARQRIQRLL